MGVLEKFKETHGECKGFYVAAVISAAACLTYCVSILTSANPFETNAGIVSLIYVVCFFICAFVCTLGVCVLLEIEKLKKMIQEKT